MIVTNGRRAKGIIFWTDMYKHDDNRIISNNITTSGDGTETGSGISVSNATNRSEIINNVSTGVINLNTVNDSNIIGNTILLKGEGSVDVEIADNRIYVKDIDEVGNPTNNTVIRFDSGKSYTFQVDGDGNSVNLNNHVTLQSVIEQDATTLVGTTMGEKIANEENVQPYSNIDALAVNTVISSIDNLALDNSNQQSPATEDSLQDIICSMSKDAVVNGQVEFLVAENSGNSNEIKRYLCPKSN